jgi:hypothetical protein
MNLVRRNCDRSSQSENGYILLVLLLMVGLLSVGLIGIIQKIDFEIKRDREEEMIHRGVQYSRAVRKFVNKFQRYPASIEELESTNNIRFLRKRYKDPITGKDFKLVHYSDMPGISAKMAAAQTAQLASQQKAGSATSGNVAGNPGDPGTDAAQVQGSDGQTDGSDAGSDAQDGSGQGSNAQEGGSQSNQNGANVSETPPPPQPLAPTVAPLQPGGWIVGVASTSKAKSIREFNKKDHYNQWQFIYDPSADPSGFLNSPSQPRMAIVVQRNQQPSDEGASASTSGTSSAQTNAPPGSPSPQ